MCFTVQEREGKVFHLVADVSDCIVKRENNVIFNIILLKCRHTMAAVFPYSIPDFTT